MTIVGWIIGIVFVAGIAVAGCVALANDEDALGRVQVASHDYEDQWSNEDENRNRNRNRGAFSPGPFDDSPVDAFNGNVVCLPGSTCYADRGDQPPDERQQP